MANKTELKTWSAKQAVAILSVDNIQMSEYGRTMLKRVEDGEITSQQAKQEILNRYRVGSKPAPAQMHRKMSGG